MAPRLGHLGQLNGIHCESRMFKVLHKNVFLSGNLFFLYCVTSYQTQILNAITVGIRVLSILGFWDLLLFLPSSSAILLGT